MTRGEVPAALQLAAIKKEFGTVQALRDVSLTVRPGTVHALLGENGAGKTTLLRVPFGLVAPDSGTVHVHGHPLATPVTPARAIAAGLGMVHQHFTLVPSMTVAENIALGGHGVYSPRAIAARIRALGDATGLAIDPHARVDTLPVSAQQRCEIMKALARDATVLILDEPTAVLAPAEARTLLQWLRRFVSADPSHAAVIITHKLRDALNVADDITVLRGGVRVATGTASEFTEASLAAAMIGSAGVAAVAGATAMDATSATSATDATNAAAVTGSTDITNPTGHPVLSALHLSVLNASGLPAVRDATFTVHSGEIVGIATVEGSGQAELLRVAAGLLPVAGGAWQAPADVRFVPEDRHRDALLLDASLTENLALRGAGSRAGRMDWSHLASRTAALLQARDVRAAGASAPARELSGGNQQKFILARALADAPAALVVENPTRGLDFNATAAVHEALREARDNGMAVLCYSSDLDEVLSLSDRVLAMHNGTVQVVARDRDAVGRAMLGAA